MRIPLAQAEPGMVLAAPVIGPGGKQLAAAGTALTAQQVALLRTWGIAAVEVVERRSTPDPAALAAAQRQVAVRFRGQPVDHPLVRALFQAAVQRQLHGGGR
ncbi:MAG: hypothetical protein RMM29_02905 [Planctomycetota bacterium]|nr:hypothetical protein [Planctomycetota bacterium]MDW8372583.1 hypothetical protein [Planctomycetota bacterium]